MLKYFLLWFPMVFLAVINGAARDLWYKKIVGELTAHQISTISLLIIFSFYIWFVVNKFPPDSGKEAILIGLFWLILTLLFEFGFGRMRGNSWAKLFEDYHIMKGRMWIFIPIWTAIAPYVFFRIAKT